MGFKHGSGWDRVNKKEWMGLSGGGG